VAPAAASPSVLFERGGRPGSCGGEIWELEAESGRARRIVARPGGVCRPARSPDGKRIAFSSRIGALYVAASDGSGTRLVVRVPARHLGWSPDSRRILFETTRPGSAGIDVDVVGVDGRELRRFAGGPGYDGAPALSPDGRTLLFVSDREHESLCAGCRQLYFLSSDPYDFGRLTGKRVNAVTAVWSPDGRWIVLARGLGPAGTIGLLVMRPDSSGAHALVAEGTDPCWTSDGRFVVFSRRGALFRVRPDGTQRRRLTDGRAFDQHPSCGG
jgi:Tol biopolymer transport system component